MVYTAVTVEVKNLKKAKVYLENVIGKTKKLGPKDSWNLTQKGVRLMRESHLESSIAWKKHIRSGIQAKKLGKNRYGIKFSKIAVALDRMEPHWVALKRGRLITRWAKYRGLVNLKTGKGLPKAIRVKSHPYIERGFRRMLFEADKMVQRLADKIVGG